MNSNLTKLKFYHTDIESNKSCIAITWRVFGYPPCLSLSSGLLRGHTFLTSANFRPLLPPSHSCSDAIKVLNIKTDINNEKWKVLRNKKLMIIVYLIKYLLLNHCAKISWKLLSIWLAIDYKMITKYSSCHYIKN